MIPAYNKKRCAAFPFETGIHFRRKTDFFAEEDTTKSYSEFEPEPTRLQAEENLIEIHRKSTTEELPSSDAELKEKKDLLCMMRDDVIKKFGASPYPLPSCLEPAFDLQYREKMNEEFYCANMPISPELLKKALDLCTSRNNITDMNEVRKLLLPALGHDHDK
ncbi:uncharacterized protein TNCV_4261751 [Trichonephila clavipes]|nr:uncharacterized protein TNCV_4261751 [Trichonephila clavipes]